MSLILLVDDDRAVANAMALTLRSLGYAVVVAPSIAHAEALLASSSPDAVITDEYLDDGQGSAWLRSVSVTRPDLPCVLLSGSLDVEPSRLPPSAVMRRKPWDFDDLEVTLRGLLSSRPSEGAAAER